MSLNSRPVPPEHMERISAALSARETAERELRDVVLAAAAAGASVRALAELTGFSTNTISRWKRGDLGL